MAAPLSAGGHTACRAAADARSACPVFMDPKLLDILVCPADRGPLLLIDDRLYNPRLHKAYRIEDGIPVLLIDEAVDVGPEEHERLMATSTASAAESLRRCFKRHSDALSHFTVTAALCRHKLPAPTAGELRARGAGMNPLRSLYTPTGAVVPDFLRSSR